MARLDVPQSLVLIGFLLVVGWFSATVLADPTTSEPVLIRLGRRIRRFLLMAAGAVLLGTYALVSFFESVFNVVLLLFGSGSMIVGAVLVIRGFRRYVRWYGLYLRRGSSESTEGSSLWPETLKDELPLVSLLCLARLLFTSWSSHPSEEDMLCRLLDAGFALLGMFTGYAGVRLCVGVGSYVSAGALALNATWFWWDYSIIP